LTINDVITAQCICLGEDATGSCDDGIQNGGEEGIDCGGSCAPCPPPIARCGRITFYVDPLAPVYDGPGTNNIWWIPSEDLDAGSFSAFLFPEITVRRYQADITFDWTTEGACIDVLTNGVINTSDKGTVYRDCLPVRNADFNVSRFYQLRVLDPFGTSQCYGTVRVIPGSPGYAAAIHLVIPADEQLPDQQNMWVEGDPPYLEPNPVNPEMSLRNLNVLPNPGTDLMNISWESRSVEPVDVRIFNSNGILSFSGSYEAAPGDNHVLIDMSGLDAGTYIIQIIHNRNEGRFARWVKIRK
jgi:hypothetical protein